MTGMLNHQYFTSIDHSGMYDREMAILIA